MKKKRAYNDFAAVDQMRNVLVPEEFPEGPFGSSIGKDEPIQSKSTSWKEGQKRASAYTYTDKELHDDLPRQGPDPHPLHDE